MVRVFTGFGTQETSDLETVEAILIDGNLYYSLQDGEYPWNDIARELTFVINPTGELRSLAVELLLILPKTIKEATKLLDNFQYPYIDITENNIVEGITLEMGASNTGN